LLALLGAHHIFHVSGLRVKLSTRDYAQSELAFLFVLSVSFIADLSPHSARDVAATAACDNERWIELAWGLVRWEACVLNLRVLFADFVFS